MRKGRWWRAANEEQGSHAGGRRIRGHCTGLYVGIFITKNIMMPS